MSDSYNPRLDILPAAQRRLWDEFDQTPVQSVLQGDTAVSLLDLAGMKAAAVQQRAEAKDYLDIDAILADGRIDLSMALASASAIYGRQFNPLITLKALSFFEDGDLPQLSHAVQERLASAARKVDLDRLPALPQKDSAR